MMQSRRFLAWGPALCGLLILAAGPASVSAQNAKTAITDVKKAGPDFAIEGEYSGRIVENASAGWTAKKYGLQVAAQGGGEFIGMLYAGGLPGSGWDRKTRFHLAGGRSGDGVQLSGDEFRVIIKKGEARLASAEKQLVGQLDKVHRQSPTLAQKPPANAVVIFDGKESKYLKGARITDDCLLMEGVDITKLAEDFQLHLEFRLPYMPYARGQGRANSGVYLHKRYEVQILDSFALDGAFNEAGALYREHKPLLNMCLPPLQWQTYDIAFTAPRFDAEGNKIKNARVTVLLNGVAVQKDQELLTPTGGGKRVGEGPNPLPINLQNHGNPVRFRNIWMVDFTNSKAEKKQNAIAKQESAEKNSSQASAPPAVVVPGVALAPPAYDQRYFYQLNNLFPGGMVPAGAVPYYVPGYYTTPLPAPVVWGW